MTIMIGSDRHIERAVAELASGASEALKRLARVAYDARWSWSADGSATFEAVNPERWARTEFNPRRQLTETHRSTLARAAADAAIVGRGRSGQGLSRHRRRGS